MLPWIIVRVCRRVKHSWCWVPRGVGLTAVELGKLMGARVIAVARGADKCAIAAQAGADHVIDATDADLQAELKALGGVDIVYDPVGGDQFKAAFRTPATLKHAF